MKGRHPSGLTPRDVSVDRCKTVNGGNSKPFAQRVDQIGKGTRGIDRSTETALLRPHLLHIVSLDPHEIDTASGLGARGHGFEPRHEKTGVPGAQRKSRQGYLTLVLGRNAKTRRTT